MALLTSQENRMIKDVQKAGEDGGTILKHLTHQLASLKMEC